MGTSTRKTCTPASISSATGLRAAYVYMEFPVDRAHSVAAFETVDRGLVFIEPQFDDEVVVVVGNRYSVDNGYEEPDYDDTIVRFTIAW
jgi:hypothetical protein